MRQRAVLREAAELAGFQVRRIVPEPEALAVWWSRLDSGAVHHRAQAFMSGRSWQAGRAGILRKTPPGSARS
jgi:hypothetical protein